MHSARRASESLTHRTVGSARPGVVNAVLAEADRRKEQRLMKEWAKKLHLD
jgi:hypothetical protein